jgi:serine/threonine protein kinase
MGIVQHLSTLAAGPVVKGACDAAGLALTDTPADKLGEALSGLFKDHSQRLGEALRKANERAWQALEVALAGDSWWQRVKGALGRKEDQALAGQIRAFLDATPLPELQGKSNYRDTCLTELRGARKAGLLGSKKEPAPAESAASTPGDLFTRFIDPRALLESESQLLDHIALELRQARFGNLADLLTLQARQGQSLLAIAARYFFRRAVEDDARLFQGLAFTQLETLQQGQEQGFAALHHTFDEQGDRLEGLLAEVQVVVAQTHEAVLDIQDEQRRQGDQARDIYQAVTDLQRRLDLMQREVRPRDSLSIRSDAERHLVKQVVARYRALPEEQRRERPALLNAVGKLEVAAGEFETAQRDFDMVATLVNDAQAKGEAHFNAYRAALERRDWASALRELIEAVRLDARRFAPFPVGKYHPQRILGAGGFGVAFLCHHKQLDADVVVKTLVDDDLEREVDQVFTEARALWQLDHPSIIRLLDCGYTFPATKQRPYFVMRYFDGKTLEEHVKEVGPLEPADLAEVARQMAQGLHAAHAKGILHRDVKPANVLLRREPGEPGGVSPRWEVKLIDFGLALKQRVLQNAGTMQHGYTILSNSIAGTVDYAAPEQLGKLPGVRIGPPADIYGFAKTCCYALFETAEPTFQDYQRLPWWAELLGRCLNKNPDKRPASLAEVLECLNRLGSAAPVRPTPREQATPDPFEPDLHFDPVPSPLPPVAKVVPPPHDTEAETAARWAALKTQMQKQVRASDWDGAWQTVDAMLTIKPYDREILEARDYLEKRRQAPKPPAKAAAPYLPPDLARLVGGSVAAAAQATLTGAALEALPERVAQVLAAYSSQSGLYLAPNIPAKKLANATEKARVPADEKVLGLIDCTVFGSATDSLIFGSRGFYYYNMGGSNPNPGFVPYSDFPNCIFATYWLNCINLGKDRYCNRAGASVGRDKIIEMLNGIKQAVIDLSV